MCRIQVNWQTTEIDLCTQCRPGIPKVSGAYNYLCFYSQLYIPSYDPNCILQLNLQGCDFFEKLIIFFVLDEFLNRSSADMFMVISASISRFLGGPAVWDTDKQDLHPQFPWFFNFQFTHYGLMCQCTKIDVYKYVFVSMYTLCLKNT